MNTPSQWLPLVFRVIMDIYSNPVMVIILSQELARMGGNSIAMRSALTAISSLLCCAHPCRVQEYLH